MEDNNSGCCGEAELPTDELEQDQIYKVKSGFRVKGEVKLRGKRTDKLIILPEDRYEYTATGSGIKHGGNDIELNHSSSSTEISSTLKSLFGDMIRTLSRSNAKTNKTKTDVIAGDLKLESDEETILEESLDKVYDSTSAKISERIEKPSKKTFKFQLQDLIRCFGSSQCAATVSTAVENFEVVIENQNFVYELDECISVEGKSGTVSEIFNLAAPCESFLLQNCGDIITSDQFKPIRKRFKVKPKYVIFKETNENVNVTDDEHIKKEIKFNSLSKKPLVVSKRKIRMPLSVKAEKLIMKQLKVNDVLFSPRLHFEQRKNEKRNSKRSLNVKNDLKNRSNQRYFNQFSKNYSNKGCHNNSCKLRGDEDLDLLFYSYLADLNTIILLSDQNHLSDGYFTYGDYSHCVQCPGYSNNNNSGGILL